MTTPSPLVMRERHTDRGLLVAACDRDVLGETYDNGGTEFTVTESFYDGEAADADAVRAALGRATIGNVVGDTAVGIAIDAGHVEAANVLELEGTVHAQFMQF
ncbi:MULTISPECIES: DUF424 domain-containing protein [Halobacterium]|uniref:DUF424 domain-containing protein n=1 Tax=Halobacterium TaxID=2239 RepID=UPI001962EF89|nr:MULTISPECIES: DUF424 domain-containing protein [Halobacterium]MDL0122564.1 DUF424 domain-containing protein [Halobacterium salinarum]MDL0127873.1 DUF424 domain-containing protein [Halobacterium salinarum]MDL0136678.1 DUF424 domain-containing protein [Halobacterium salinarum]MDL0145159.1 DUF424 domain-containing protein [Halobacterium salinarum]QRY24667.1 DUF424 domain-containing protein [Halobacterium sp. BOL4-2]